MRNIDAADCGVWRAKRSSPRTREDCGRAEGPDGQPLAGFELRLVQEDQTLVSELYTDAFGDFSFPQLPKGDYFMATTSKGWWPLGWPVRVTDLRAPRNCKHPLTVRPSLVCGGSISQKGYHRFKKAYSMNPEVAVTGR